MKIALSESALGTKFLKKKTNKNIKKYLKKIGEIFFFYFSEIFFRRNFLYCV